MPRTARIIVYDFADEASLEKQLSGSLAEGVRKVGGKGSIRVVTLPSPAGFWRKLKVILKALS